MRIPQGPADVAILCAILFPFVTVAVGNIDCSHIVIDKAPFDLSELDGPKSVLHSVDQGVSLKNTTYTIDICKNLVRAKGVPKNDQCPSGTRGVPCSLGRKLDAAFLSSLEKWLIKCSLRNRTSAQ